ncbi:hypothetical protein GGR56DRAFT_337055 [Xylariaceae sp. FL0804]|nr:hypothetical protein GGR56DRAFT_337055 [Xylariaceae sp. FL0804]
MSSARPSSTLSYQTAANMPFLDDDGQAPPKSESKGPTKTSNQSRRLATDGGDHASLALPVRAAGVTEHGEHQRDGNTGGHLHLHAAAGVAAAPVPEDAAAAAAAAAAAVHGNGPAIDTSDITDAHLLSLFSAEPTRPSEEDGQRDDLDCPGGRHHTAHAATALPANGKEEEKKKADADLNGQAPPGGRRAAEEEEHAADASPGREDGRRRSGSTCNGRLDVPGRNRLRVPRECGDDEDDDAVDADDDGEHEVEVIYPRAPRCTWHLCTKPTLDPRVPLIAVTQPDGRVGYPEDLTFYVDDCRDDDDDPADDDSD